MATAPPGWRAARSAATPTARSTFSCRRRASSPSQPWRRRHNSGQNPMSDYRTLFKYCGTNVTVAPDVYIEHPEVMEVGNNVHFMKGFYMMDGPSICRIGNDVNFYPNCFIQGRADRLIIDQMRR